MKSYHLTTFGCQMNEHDSERMKGMLQALGYAEAPQREQADLILFNTCSIRESADSRFIAHLGQAKRLKRERPERVIGVGGCWAQSVKEEVFARFPFDETFPLAAGEDREWCSRIGAAGVAISLEPEAIVAHHQDLSLRRYWRQQVRYGRGALRWRRFTRSMMALKVCRWVKRTVTSRSLVSTKPSGLVSSSPSPGFLCGVTGTERVKTPSSYCSRLENSISSSCSRGGISSP